MTIGTLKTAFRKLLSSSYIDKNDLVMRRSVAEFAARLSTQNKEDIEFNKILSIVNGESEESFNELLGKMSLMYYPKSVKNPDTDTHILTNIPEERAHVERLLVRCSIPVELHIIDVAWILEYGYVLDSLLSEHCYANRLELSDDEPKRVKKGNVLFKLYHSQYHSWWQNGLDEANKYLSNNEDVSIINFDIQNCYHSINLDFDKLISELRTYFLSVGFKEDNLTQLLRRIYDRYWELIWQSSVDLFRDKKYHSLPLSLFSAHIIANWYLKPLDDYIMSQYHPIYYGRYVDDCMLVVRTTSKTKGDVLMAINEELSGILTDKKDKTVVFSFAQNNNLYNSLSTLSIQLDKLFLYRFDCQLPQSSIEQMEEEFKERSSEFRFLTDDMDVNGVRLEFATLIQALDPSKESGRRFNILEDNKYKLAVYLAKLARKLAYYEDEKYLKEVDKIKHYFHGSLLVKHYLLWERILTVFVLADRQDYVNSFLWDVEKAVSEVSTKEDLFGDTNEELVILRNTLLQHLKESKLMASSLRPSKDIDKIYIETYMMRMYFNRYPLQEFLLDFRTKGTMMTEFNPVYSKSHLSYRWMPYFVKYYDIVCMLTLKNPAGRNIYKTAYKYYLTLNNIEETEDKKYIDKFLFVQSSPKTIEFNTSLKKEQHNDKPITVAVAEIDRSEKETFKVLDTFGQMDFRKVYDMQKILDNVTSIRNSDIFILPELSLPIYELRQFCEYAASRQKAFVAGMEFIVHNKTEVYNCIITCLPITMFGQLDAIPVIRTKHHYAPAEVERINAQHKIGPKSPCWQYLYHWKGHLFTTYYCYELCDIAGRSYFKSKIDAMYAPVFNKDTYYFNNIAESWVRDMHAYFVLSNVSHLGDSRITQPSSHVYMNKMKVKGGNTKENRVVVLSGELDINGLRDFQQNGSAQPKSDSDKTQEKESFKSIPPGYDIDSVDLRKNKYFILSRD